MSEQASTKSYKGTLIALLILTVITVGISRIPLGAEGNIGIGILVAVVKASLVVAFFMHMKNEKRSWLGIILFPVVLVMIIIFSNFPDTALNGIESKGDMTTPALKIIPHRGKQSPEDHSAQEHKPGHK